MKFFDFITASDFLAFHNIFSSCRHRNDFPFICEFGKLLDLFCPKTAAMRDS